MTIQHANVSGLHGDMLQESRDGGEIRADDVLICRNVRFIPAESP